MSIRRVTTTEALRDLRALLDAVQRGEHIALTRRDNPVAVIVPVEWHERNMAAPTQLTEDNPVRLGGEVLWATDTDLVMRLITEVFRRAGHKEARVEALNALLNEAVAEFLDRIDAEGLIGESAAAETA